jgi:subtilisin family serine protease
VATSVKKVKGNPAFAYSKIKSAGSKHAEVDRDKLIIRFKDDALQPAAAVAARGKATVAAFRSALPESVTGPMRRLTENLGLSEMVPLFTGRPAGSASVKSSFERHTRALVKSVTRSPAERLRGITVCKVDAKSVTEQELKRLRSSNAIASVERVPMRWLAATKKPKVKFVDPMRNAQWGLRAIGWFDAKIPDASMVEVAVLDTGIDMTHPDLAEQIAHYDRGGAGARDLLGHGTHVSGIIAAVANNDVGIAGVANCRLNIWKIFPDTPDVDGDFVVDSEAYLRALGEVAMSQVRVVNLSIGGTAHSPIEQDLFNLLAENGKIAVAAMGNEFEEGDPVEYPAAYENVIAVGAVDIGSRRARFSNTGKHITLVAPGQDILSTLPMKASKFMEDEESEFAHWDGTSMATPFVVGALALACAKRPTLTLAAALKLLQKRAVRLPAMKTAKFTKEFGHGLLHVPTLLK